MKPSGKHRVAVHGSSVAQGPSVCNATAFESLVQLTVSGLDY